VNALRIKRSHVRVVPGAPVISTTYGVLTFRDYVSKTLSLTHYAERRCPDCEVLQMSLTGILLRRKNRRARTNTVRFSNREKAFSPGKIF